MSAPVLELSADQREALGWTADWYQDRQSGSEDLTLGGYAGTGKTFTLARVPSRLGLRQSEVAFVAPTNKAKKVITRKLRANGIAAEATTIHRLIYISRLVHGAGCPAGQDEDEDCTDNGCRWVRELRQSLDPRLKLIAADEASMVYEELYRDARSFDIPALWTGDHGQLPPVNDDFNLMERPAIRLERIHRQGGDSPILDLAMEARTVGYIPVGEYGPGVRKARRDSALTWEEEVLTYADLQRDDLLILAWTNKTRVAINRAVRECLGRPEEEPVPGDRVVCREDGPDKGTTGVILDVRAAGQKCYYARIAVDGEERVISGRISRAQFNYPERYAPSVARASRWDYSYCLTVHDSQGSEAEAVLLLEEVYPWKRHRDVDFWRRWLYTGVTRAISELTIVG